MLSFPKSSCWNGPAFTEHVGERPSFRERGVTLPLFCLSPFREPPLRRWCHTCRAYYTGDLIQHRRTQDHKVRGHTLLRPWMCCLQAEGWEGRSPGWNFREVRVSLSLRGRHTEVRLLNAPAHFFFGLQVPHLSGAGQAPSRPAVEPWGSGGSSQHVCSLLSPLCGHRPSHLGASGTGKGRACPCAGTGAEIADVAGRREARPR